MVIFLCIVLVACIAACVWQFIANERKLRERIDEYNKACDLHQKELQGARHKVEEAMSEMAEVRKTYDKLLKEHEALYKEYNTLKKAATHHCGCDAKAETAETKPKKKPGRPRKKPAPKKQG